MVPGFWEWLVRQGRTGAVKIPLEVYEEITPTEELFTKWIANPETKKALRLEHEADPAFVRRVVAQGYAADLTEDEQEIVGRDPFLIAHALESPSDTTVVTTEGSKPGKKRANRHIPDVCAALGIRCCGTFQMTRALKFRV